MELPITELHQVGSQIVHLVIDRIDSSEEYLALIEGGGVCLANTFKTQLQADVWLHSMFGKLFRSHCCDLGCIRLPGWEFLADDEVLQQLSDLTDSPPN